MNAVMDLAQLRTSRIEAKRIAMEGLPLAPKLRAMTQTR